MAEDGDQSPHTPVLFQEVLSALKLGPGSRIIDGTIGAAGHARGILESSGPNGLLLGLDRDPAALDLARRRLQKYGTRVILAQDSFARMLQHMHAAGWQQVSGVLLDLGLSSMQLEHASRGFSFRLDGPLDMRFDPQQDLTAAELINHLDEKELADIFRKYGEEPKAGRIARAIVEARPMYTTHDLADLVSRTLRAGKRRIHPATRIFQALRIVVNDELKTLEEGLVQATRALGTGGRLAVISFHSLEDRIVKQYFKGAASDCTCPPEQPICTCDAKAVLRLITRKPIRPDEKEIRQNPRARSARMRVAEKRGMA